MRNDKEKWRRCPQCRKAGTESSLQTFKWYGSRRNGRRLPSGFRCPACGCRGSGYEFRYAERPTADPPRAAGG